MYIKMKIRTCGASIG